MPVSRRGPGQRTDSPTLLAVRGAECSSLILVSLTQRFSLLSALLSDPCLLLIEPLGELPASFRPRSTARQPVCVGRRSVRLNLCATLALDKLFVAPSQNSARRQTGGRFRIGSEHSFQRRLGRPAAHEGCLGGEYPAVRQRRGHHHAAAFRLDDATKFREHAVGLLPRGPARRDPSV